MTETRDHLSKDHGFSNDYLNRKSTKESTIENWHRKEHKAGESKFGQKHSHSA